MSYNEYQRECFFREIIPVGLLIFTCSILWTKHFHKKMLNEEKKFKEIIK